MNIKWMGCDSSNYSKGRQGNKISKLVLHWICGTLESADATFNNPSRNASAHYGVGDNVIHQYVKDENTAWHCGDWLWNLKTIGIEHKGGPNLPISEQTYTTSALLVKDLCAKYNIPLDREHITGHSDYVATQCPGTLDIDKVIKLAKGGPMEYLANDIPTEVEDKFKLKKIERYSKYWSFIDLIEDWTKICKELDKLEETFKKKRAELEESLDEALRQYNILEAKKEALESNLRASQAELKDECEKHKLDVSVLEQQLQDLSTQHASLLEKYEKVQEEMDEGYGDQIKRLKGTIGDLESRVTQLQRPIPTISEALVLLGKSIKEGVWS